MTDSALQITKAKVGANVKKSYYELERCRQISHVAQKMASSVSLLLNVGTASDSIQVRSRATKW
jgi:hypothetical protein